MPTPPPAPFTNTFFPGSCRIRSAQIQQGDESGSGDRTGLFERDVSRLERELVLTNGVVFGVGASRGPSVADGGFTKHLVTLPKPRHRLANTLDDSRDVRARNWVLGSEHPGSHQAKDIRPPGHDMPHVWMDRRCAYANQDVIVANVRFVDVSDQQVVNGPVPFLDNRLHCRFNVSRRVFRPAAHVN